jgi:hypothetical protein
MKEANWKECIENSTVRKITPDLERAKSLEETAKDRISLIKEINPKNCNFVFEDYYTSLLEILEAQAFKKGFNVLNHICIGYFLKSVLNRNDLYFLFDDLRYKRNSLTYYGNRMEFEIAIQAIKNCKKIIKEIINIYQK